MALSCQKEINTYQRVEPATVEHIEGKEFNILTLTPKAVARLGIESALPSREETEGKSMSVIPYSAVLYGPYGQTWIYTNPRENVFIREAIAVERVVDGRKVILKDGLAKDLKVVVTGSAELYGTEYQVGH
ncbi:MAG: hypothetical protein AAFR59_01070 [Bacteroidota bacterium]